MKGEGTRKHSVSITRRVRVQSGVKYDRRHTYAAHTHRRMRERVEKEKKKYARSHTRIRAGIYWHSATIDAILRYDNCFRYERRVASIADWRPLSRPDGGTFYGRATSNELRSTDAHRLVQIQVPITKDARSLSSVKSNTGQDYRRGSERRRCLAFLLLIFEFER